MVGFLSRTSDIGVDTTFGSSVPVLAVLAHHAALSEVIPLCVATNAGIVGIKVGFGSRTLAGETLLVDDEALRAPVALSALGIPVIG